MQLHTSPDIFQELITIVSNELNISESAVERDYYIVMMLQKLADSPYRDFLTLVPLKTEFKN